MRQLMLAAAVMSAAFAGRAHAQSRPADEGPPPPRWWQFADGLFSDRLRSLTLTVALDDAQLAKADARAAEYRRKAADAMRLRQSEIDALSAEYLAYRSRISDGEPADPEAEARLNAASRSLYEPIAALLNEFAAELRAVREAAKALPAPAAPAGETPAEPAAPQAATPAAPQADGIWATEAQVAEMLAALPEPPDGTRLEQALALHVGSRTATARQQTLLEGYRSRLEAARAAQAGEWGRVRDVIDILRRHPAAVRPAALTVTRDHWLELTAALEGVVAEFRTELTKAP